MLNYKNLQCIFVSLVTIATLSIRGMKPPQKYEIIQNRIKSLVPPVPGFSDNTMQKSTVCSAAYSAAQKILLTHKSKLIAENRALHSKISQHAELLNYFIQFVNDK